MDHRKIPNLALAIVVIASLLVAASGATSAAVPAPDVSVSAFERDATLQGKISAAVAPLAAPYTPNPPHYFGPWPNWANSPMTVPAATVTIDPPRPRAASPPKRRPRLGWVASSRALPSPSLAAGIRPPLA